VHQALIALLEKASKQCEVDADKITNLRHRRRMLELATALAAEARSISREVWAA
jgi:hypothetical protein